jgi:hypothetical protein
VAAGARRSRPRFARSAVRQSHLDRRRRPRRPLPRRPRVPRNHRTRRPAASQRRIWRRRPARRQRRRAGHARGLRGRWSRARRRPGR